MIEENDQTPSAPTPAKEPEPSGRGMFVSDPDDRLEFFGEKPKPVSHQPPPPEMPKIDLDSIGVSISQAMKQQAQQATMGDFQNIKSESDAVYRELATLSQKDQMSISEDERIRAMALQSRYQQLGDLMNRQLPIAHQLRDQMMQLQGSQITQLQRQAATEYPEIADRILDMARSLPIDKQGDPLTYKVLAQNIYGEKEMEKRAKDRISNAGNKASGARSGRISGGDEPYTASKADIDRLRRMKMTDKMIKETLERMNQ